MVQEVSLICQYICQIILHNFVQPSLASFTRCTLYEEASVFSTYIRYNEANIFMYYHLHRMHTSLIVGRAGLLQNKQTSCSHYVRTNEKLIKTFQTQQLLLMYVLKVSRSRNKIIESFFWEKLWLDNFVLRSTDL